VNNFDELRSHLTDSDWVAVILADADGPLPPCCGELSMLRDRLVNYLVGRGDTGAAIALGQALEADTHLEGDHPIVALRTALTAHLDATVADWRNVDLDADAAAIDEFALRLALTGTSRTPVADPGPFEQWNGPFTTAASQLGVLEQLPATDDRYSTFTTFRDACNAARIAGAPTRLVDALYREGLGRLRTNEP
jgi:hypothetical protein